MRKKQYDRRRRRINVVAHTARETTSGINKNKS
jgi:hypothetical protein